MIYDTAQVTKRLKRIAQEMQQERARQLETEKRLLSLSSRLIDLECKR